jgi:hypothetical protein
MPPCGSLTPRAPESPRMPTPPASWCREIRKPLLQHNMSTKRVIRLGASPRNEEPESPGINIDYSMMEILSEYTSPVSTPKKPRHVISLVPVDHAPKTPRYVHISSTHLSDARNMRIDGTRLSDSLNCSLSSRTVYHEAIILPHIRRGRRNSTDLKIIFPRKLSESIPSRTMSIDSQDVLKTSSAKLNKYVCYK